MRRMSGCAITDRTTTTTVMSDSCGGGGLRKNRSSSATALGNLSLKGTAVCEDAGGGKRNLVGARCTGIETVGDKRTYVEGNRPSGGVATPHFYPLLLSFWIKVTEHSLVTVFPWSTYDTSYLALF